MGYRAKGKIDKPGERSAVFFVFALYPTWEPVHKLEFQSSLPEMINEYFIEKLE